MTVQLDLVGSRKHTCVQVSRRQEGKIHDSPSTMHEEHQAFVALARELGSGRDNYAHYE